ncbi:transposase [Streptomyces virginiae]|uniref:transposase n=1 Tax=Streptomyces virginiae TaxID=1961 RepID=UPI0037A2810D
MPEVGVRTGARILIDVGDGDGDGDGSTFPTAGHLAAHAGLAPTTRRSGSSIRGEQPSRRGHDQLERVLSLPSFAASGDPASRIHHDRKITQGTHRTQALPCLAGRRTGILFAVLRDGPATNPGLPPRADPHRARRRQDSPLHRDSRSRQGDHTRRTDACPHRPTPAHTLHRS